MFARREIYFAFLLIAASDIFAYMCPTNEKCKCESNTLSQNVKILCQINNSSINIVIQSNNSMMIRCSNWMWTDFQLYNLTKRPINKIYFSMCDLPKNSNLKTITDILGATDVKKLVFYSYKYFTPLRRLHLKGFENLYELGLGEKTLKSIEPGTFDKFHNLTWLSLKRNNLTELQSRIFDDLVNLKFLYLFSNNLANLPEVIFRKLKNLEVLSLAKNKFKLLPRHLLQENTNLRTVDLSYNEKELHTLPNGFFYNLTKLATLTLEKSGLMSLPEDLLWGCFSLTTLVLSKNNLVDLPTLIFRDSKKMLTELDLKSNAFEKVPNIFRDLKKLRKLDLSKNRILSIDGDVFRELHNLEELNMAENYLTIISDGSLTFLRNLEIANFSHNNLTLHPSNYYFDYEDMESPFASCYFLQELYLGNNRISEIFNDWVRDFENLQKLDLKNNCISSLSTEDLQFASEDIEVDLTNNKIKHIFLHKAEDFFKHDWTNKVVILIDNNPVHCDCELYDYLRYIEDTMPPNIKRYIKINPKNLTCFTPLKLRNFRVTNLQSKLFTCTAINSTRSLASMCPDKCNCSQNLDEQVFVIDCFRKNFTVVPSVKSIPHKFWQIKLNLSDNQLSQMPNLTELGYGLVNKLILSDNKISEISLDKLKTLEVLELHNNRISKISSDVLNFLKNSTNLYALTLHGNPWLCDCSTRDFFNFTRTFKSYIVVDLHKITCHEKDKYISNMTIIDFCPNNNMSIRETSSSSKLTWIILVIFGFSIGLLCYIFREQLKNNLARLLVLAHQSPLTDDDENTEEEEETNIDEGNCYDIFVSYSQNDHEFVMDKLVQKLENGPPPLKLFLPYRDWSINERTTENMVKFVKSSKQMIVVLSQGFLENVWSNTELRVAHCEASAKPANESKVILILYADIIPTDEDLGSQLKTYINSNEYIKWENPWFWKNLQLLMHDFKDEASGSDLAFRYYSESQRMVSI